MGLFCGSSSVFLGGFVFVTAAVVAHTQHTEHFLKKKIETKKINICIKREKK
jgi:hypothetical protein